MMAFVNAVLLIINIISSIIIILILIFGIYEQIVGLDDAKKLLKDLHIPLSYNQVLVLLFVCFALMDITYILRAKLSGEL